MVIAAVAAADDDDVATADETAAVAVEGISLSGIPMVSVVVVVAFCLLCVAFMSKDKDLP